MNFKDYLNYYDDITKIYAICIDLDIPDEKIRLLSFMHVKISENDIDYLDNPRLEEIQALQIMLGDSKKIIEILQEENFAEKQIETINKSMQTLANFVIKADTQLAKEYGLENRLSSELKYRLFLYENAKFREHMLKLYKKEIEPRICLYDKQKINIAFEKYQEKLLKKEQEFQELLK
jgi:hypothetical protein